LMECSMKKNVASQKIGAQLVNATDGSAFTGSVTVYVTGDAGTQAAGSVGSGACTHEGNGYHTYAPAQAETNYDIIGFTFTGTGAVPATVQVFTSFPQTGDNFALIGATGSGLTSLATQASVNTIDDFLDTEISAIKAVTDAIPNAGALTTIQADLDDIQTRLPAALVSGRMDSSVGAMAANTITDAAIAADVTAVVADSVWNAATATYGAAGSYGLLVETNIDAAVSSRLATAGYTAPDNASIAAILVDTAEIGAAGAGLTVLATAAALATVDTVVDSILVDTAEIGVAGAGLTALASAANLAIVDGVVDAILVDTAEIGVAGAGLTALATQASVNTIDDFLDTEIAAILAAVDTEVSAIKAKTDNLPASPAAVSDIPTAAAVADAVWDEAIAGHAGAGSTGAALSSASAAGDPWGVAIPGAYGAGTAGKIVGDNLNATVSSRLATVGYTAPDNASIAAILIDTAEIGAAGAGLTALATQASVTTIDDFLDTEVAAILAAVDTEVGAIKAKTDLIPAAPAAVGDIPTADITNILADTNDIQSRLPAALVGGRMDSNLSAIGNDTTALTAFKRAVLGNVIGTVGAASSTTSIVTSSLLPAAAVIDQYKGRILIFDKDTTTANLRGQGSDITGNTALGVLTVTALTDAPVSGDTFTIT
jgi:hypothetical protein